MKTLDQLLQNIEDDMELFGRDHIIYLWKDQKTGQVMDYDFLPDEDYEEAETLQLLKDQLEKIKFERETPQFQLPEHYPVITICGSTRFKKEFLEVQKRLTLEGKIVISVGLFGHEGDAEVWEGMDEGTVTRTKLMLDDMHKRKIDMADGIFVVNVGGYIGSSTESEIKYALEHGKTVEYLEK